MRIFERASIKSEIAAARQLLAALPESDFFTRLSLNDRIRELHEKLDDNPGVHFQSRLTFRGEPVVGSAGISASFGAKAVGAFSEAVSTVGASLRGVLAARGPLPDRSNFEMLITGTAVGSFGFELESRNGELVDGGMIQEAVDRAQLLLQASSVEEDEALAEAAVGLDPRAISAVRAFAEVLVQNNALCTVSTARRIFSFNRPDEVIRCVDRLQDGHIVESEETLEGALVGALPNSRTFEFKLSEGEVIRGKVDPAVGQLDGFRDSLELKSTIRVRITKVGEGRPKYFFIGRPVVVD